MFCRKVVTLQLRTFLTKRVSMHGKTSVSCTKPTTQQNLKQNKIITAKLICKRFHVHVSLSHSKTTIEVLGLISMKCRVSLSMRMRRGSCSFGFIVAALRSWCFLGQTVRENKRQWGILGLLPLEEIRLFQQ